MTILLLAPQPFFTNRGTPIAVRVLLEGLSRLGHAVDLLTYHEGADVDIPRVRHLRIPRPPLVQAVPIGPSWQKAVCDLYLLGKAISLIRRNRYDLVHAVEESAIIAAGLQMVLGLPFVMDMDSLLSRQIREKSAALAPVATVFGWLERWAIRRSLGVLAVCPALVDEALRFHPTGNVALLPDTPMGGGRRGALPEALTSAPRPRFMYVGNLEPYQGIGLMLEGFARFVGRETGSAASLVVVGGNEASIRRYRRQAESLGIAAGVRFVGAVPVEQLGQVLETADVLLSPRVQGNNTPMKIYSYLGSGRAVIATRLPTHTQVLNDDVALLVEPDPESLGAAMSRLLANATERESLGARGRAYVETEFGQAAFQRRLRDFYDKLEIGVRERTFAVAVADGAARQGAR